MGAGNGITYDTELLRAEAKNIKNLEATYDEKITNLKTQIDQLINNDWISDGSKETMQSINEFIKQLQACFAFFTEVGDNFEKAIPNLEYLNSLSFK